MKKDWVFINILIVLSFCLTERCYAEIWDFTQSFNKGIRFTAYIDGVQAVIDGFGSKEHSFTHYNSISRWDIDPDNLTAKMLSIDVPKSINETRTLNINEPGFGGLQLQVEVTLQESIFSLSKEFGPYPIEPFNLTFDMPSETGYDEAIGTVQHIGFVEFENQILNFDLTEDVLHVSTHHGEFDDTNYPQNLNLWTSIIWINTGPDLLVSTIVNGKVVEIYSDHEFMGGVGGTGVLVPEPATLSLMAFGCLELLKRRKK